MAEQYENDRRRTRCSSEEDFFPELHECDAFLKHYVEIHDWLSRLTRCPHTGADLAQETYSRALRYYSPKAPPRHARGWLWKIALNVARDHFRKARHDGVTNFDDLDVLLAEAAALRAEDPPVPEVGLDDLLETIVALPSESGHVIVGFYFEEKSCRDLAKELGIKYPAVRVRLYRARKRMLKRLICRVNRLR